MVIHKQYIYLSKYNSWINQRLYEIASSLSDEERKRDVKAFFKSIHGTFNHLLLADRTWMRRFTKNEKKFSSYNENGEKILIQSLDQELYQNFERLRSERVSTDVQIEQWINSLDSKELNSTLIYENSRGQQQEPMWWAISHFFNHQTHHRGQITTMFKQLNKDPGITDFIVFLREYRNGNIQ